MKQFLIVDPVLIVRAALVGNFCVLNFLEVEKADLTWVYVVGASSAVIIILVTAIICWRVKKQQKITDEVKEERKNGIHKQWGFRSQNSILLKQAADKEESGRKEMLNRSDFESDANNSKTNTSNYPMNVGGLHTLNIILQASAQTSSPQARDSNSMNFSAKKDRYARHHLSIDKENDAEQADGRRTQTPASNLDVD